MLSGACRPSMLLRKASWERVGCARLVSGDTSRYFGSRRVPRKMMRLQRALRSNNLSARKEGQARAQQKHYGFSAFLALTPAT